VDSSHSLEFELTSATIGREVHVRLTRARDRWVASISCGATVMDGLGASAREAFVAAVSAFGPRASRALMAEPALLGVSARLNTMEAAV
jgi:hypothetical protein